MWYEAKPKNFEIVGDGEPYAYFSIKEQAEKYSMKLWGNEEVEEFEPESQLEYIVSKDDLKPIASFRFEGHAIDYNIKYLNGKGVIYPEI